jgi:GNAT superfamily N-acetyltransferase
MTQTPLIRSVELRDFEPWKVLWDGYNAFYGREGPTALPEANTRTTWSRFFDASEPVHALVAEAGGQLLGLAHYLFHRSTIDIHPVCYMQDLFTSHAARRKGVGRALIETVYERARAAGCVRVYWHTYNTNVTARQLYDQLAQHNGGIVYRHGL